MTSANYPSLRGRHIAVTGGASGIGAGLVEAFARQGACVTFLDILDAEGRTLERSLAHSPSPPRFQQCDLKDLDALDAFFADIDPVDVLVNNAASDDRHRLEDVTSDYWDDRMAVNLRHILFCTKAVVDGMRRNGGGVVINFGSISWHLGLTDLVLYETAKAGIEGMTRSLARELGPDGIRVVAVVPGNVQTSRQQRWYTPEDEAQIVAAQAIKERIQPSDVASLVLYLASDDARMCTGHSYWVDAGWR